MFSIRQHIYDLEMWCARSVCTLQCAFCAYLRYVILKCAIRVAYCTLLRAFDPQLVCYVLKIHVLFCWSGRKVGLRLCHFGEDPRAFFAGRSAKYVMCEKHACCKNYAFATHVRGMCLIIHCVCGSESKICVCDRNANHTCVYLKLWCTYVHLLVFSAYASINAWPPICLHVLYLF